MICITHLCMHTSETQNLLLWPKRPPSAFSVAEMSRPKRPRYSDIFIIGTLWLFFFFCFFFLGGGGKNFVFQYFGGFSEDFVDIFLGSSQNWTIFRAHYYTF